METVKEAEMDTKMEMDTETDMAATGPLALSHWKRVVVLIQTDLQEGRLEKESTWQAVVLITKGV